MNRRTVIPAPYQAEKAGKLPWTRWSGSRRTLFTDSEAGFIRINDTDITEETKGVSDASSWSGRYFAGTAQRLRAEAKDGHGFVKFVVTDLAEGTTGEYRDPAIEVTLGSAGTKAEAVFE